MLRDGSCAAQAWQFARAARSAVWRAEIQTQTTTTEETFFISQRADYYSTTIYITFSLYYIWPATGGHLDSVGSSRSSLIDCSRVPESGNDQRVLSLRTPKRRELGADSADLAWIVRRCSSPSP